MNYRVSLGFLEPQAERPAVDGVTRSPPKTIGRQYLLESCLFPQPFDPIMIFAVGERRVWRGSESLHAWHWHPENRHI